MPIIWMSSLIILLGFFITGIPFAEEICEFYFKGCPEDYHGDTIVVPDHIVALSQDVYVCEPSEVIENVIDSGGGPPSIVFIIDHSYSMLGTGTIFPGRDPYGARFRVVEDIIDTIFSVHPTAEISIVVFREKLYFDHRNYSHFVALPGAGDGSYLPLLKLNETQTGGKTGKEIVHEVLLNDTVILKNPVLGNIDVECVDLVYKPQFGTVGNTNINCAFNAAKEAMKSSSYKKESQFFIFLSDGKPFKGENDPSPYDFVNGTGCPTTFTVFFTPDTIAPDSLVLMNANIQNNGYSKLNPKSELWTIDANYDTLMSLLMTNVITSIVLEYKSKPFEITINGQTSTSYNNQWFLYSNKFVLQDQLSYFTFDIDYTVTNSNTGITHDTATHSEFWVKIDTVLSLPDDFDEWCWDRNMVFFYNGDTIYYADETMAQLEVRFFWSPGDADYEYTSVPFVITHTEGTSKDSEIFSGTNNTSYFSTTFSRTVANANAGDGTLQHAGVDSIVAIFRNPEIPLDTLRKAIPFRISESVEMIYGTYFDRNADGYVDSIPVMIHGTYNIADINELAGAITLPAERGFTISNTSIISGGIAFTVNEENVSDPNARPKTYITTNDTLVIQQTVLPNGGWVVGKSALIIDSMAPVINSAHLTDVQSDSIHDTLVVIFSENVRNITQNQPFFFRNPQTQIQYFAYLHLIRQSGDAAEFWVDYLKGVNGETVETMEKGDSIWINPSYDLNVYDDLLNEQKNPMNIRRLLDNKLIHNPIEFILTGTTIINPNIGIEIPITISQLLTKLFPLIPIQTLNGKIVIKGIMILSIKPDNPDNLMNGERFEADVAFYDPVGNEVWVVPEEDITYYDGGGNKDNAAIFFLWEGKNTNYRKVGAGSYLVLANIRRIDKNESIVYRERQTLMVGVSRD